LFLYDQFLLELMVITKTKVDKLYHYVVNAEQHGSVVWLASYYKALTGLLAIENCKDFYSKNVMLHILWELCGIFLTLSQASYLTLEQLLASGSGFALFSFFRDLVSLPQPDSFESGLIYLFCVSLRIADSNTVQADPARREQQKYDDTNIFDLKLQEFFVINFTAIKIELHDYFKNLAENKFPRLLVVFNQAVGGSLGSLKFFGSHFATNHNANFKVGLAFLLFQHGETLQCESVLKQILEKDSPGLHTKL
jgi:hypothetical protein